MAQMLAERELVSISTDIKGVFFFKRKNLIVILVAYEFIAKTTFGQNLYVVKQATFSGGRGC